MLFQRLLRTGLWANGSGIIYCSSLSTAANPKLSLNDISNVKAKVIRTIRYKGLLCSPPELRGDRKQPRNVSHHGHPSLLCLISHKTALFWGFAFFFFFAISWIKLRKIIGLFFFFKGTDGNGRVFLAEKNNSPPPLSLRFNSLHVNSSNIYRVPAVD